MQVAQNNLAPPRPNMVNGVEPFKEQTASGQMDFKSMFGQNMFQVPEGGGGQLNLFSKATPKGLDSNRMKFEGKSPRAQSPSASAERSSDQVGKTDREADTAKSSRVDKKHTDGKKLASHKIKDSSRKTGAVQKFMDSLEGELGISAERFSAALAQLPPEVKAMPVEKSAAYVIAQLGIGSADQEGATNAYVNLLQTSGINGLDAEGASGGQGAIDLSSLGLDQSIKQTDRQKLNATIDELNRRFFETGKNLSANRLQGLEGGNQATELNEMMINDSTGRLSRLDEMTSGIQASSPNMSSMSLNEVESLAFSDVDEGSLKLESNMENSPKLWSVEELPFLLKQNGADGNSFENSFGQGADNGEAFTSQSMSGERLDSAGFEGNQFFNGMSGATNSMIKNQALAKGVSSQVAINSEERIANINKVSAATESLAIKGGGELKVMLTPEGLGNVHLKVKMQDGKLQVEMKADNQESKQLIESSLSELKNQLSSQKLSIDSVKVDIAGDFNRQDSNSQLTQQQFDLGRDQARQFMNQFREGNFSQRQSLFEVPGFKNYRSQREEALAPISSEIRPRGSLNVNKGNGVNLVA